MKKQIPFSLLYPIIQAPMLGITTPKMVADVSNLGGLGSLPVGGLSPELTQQLIRETKALTNQPFAVNLFVHDIPECAEEMLEAMRQLLLQLATKRGYRLDPASMSSFQFHTYREQLGILLEEGIHLVSFTFGCLDEPSIQLLQSNRCTLIGTATCVEEALFLEEKGIDMVVAQGLEAGGHRGTFLEHLPLPQIGLFSLLPQITNKVSIPCIAAGGINDSSSIQAAFDQGAAAVQIGTPFIGTEESLAIASYKTKLEEATGTATVLTRSFSGRWARGIRNEMMRDIDESGVAIPPYPWQNSLTTQLRKLALQQNDSEYINLWAGQSSGTIKGRTTKEIFLYLIKEYERRSSIFPS